MLRAVIAAAVRAGTGLMWRFLCSAFHCVTYNAERLIG